MMISLPHRGTDSQSENIHPPTLALGCTTVTGPINNINKVPNEHVGRVHESRKPFLGQRM